MRWRAANLDIGSIRLEDPGHRILALTVASAHPLVLTVSHDSPAATLRCDGLRPPCFLELFAFSSSSLHHVLRFLKCFVSSSASGFRTRGPTLPSLRLEQH